MSIQTTASTVGEVAQIANQILLTIGTLDPAIAPETTAIAGIESLVLELVTKALAAYSAASGIPITVESVTALLPNQEPLTPPTE